MEFLPHGRRYRITDNRTDEQVQRLRDESEWCRGRCRARAGTVTTVTTGTRPRG